MLALEKSVAVTGIGQSDVGRRLDRDPMALTIDACLAAIEDAGLTREDIDGLSTYPGAGMAGAGLTAHERRVVWTHRLAWFLWEGQFGVAKGEQIAKWLTLCRGDAALMAQWQGLASSINVGAFNLGNALGAALGGAVISSGLGYAAIPVAGGLLAASGLLLAWLGRPRTAVAEAC